MQTIKDVLFGTVLFAVLAYAGFTFFGAIEGVALWRVFFLTGTAGFTFGYRARARLDSDYWRGHTDGAVLVTRRALSDERP